MEKDFTASAKGSCVTAQDHSIAAGPGGVGVGGKVRDIHTHGRKEGSE